MHPETDFFFLFYSYALEGLKLFFLVCLSWTGAQSVSKTEGMSERVRMRVSECKRMKLLELSERCFIKIV